MDKLTLFLKENPHYTGLFIALVGIGLLISAIVNANWLFGNVSDVTYSLKKVDGWINMFGRKTARIIFGIMSCLVILAGIAWFLLGNSK